MNTVKNLTGFWNHLLFISFGLVSVAVIVLPLGSSSIQSVTLIGLALVGVYVIAGTFGWNWAQQQNNPRAMLIYFVVQAAVVFLNLIINLIAFEEPQISLLVMPVMYQTAIFPQRMRLLLLGAFMAATVPINLIFGSQDPPGALRSSLLMFFFSGVFVLVGSIVIREEQQKHHIQALLSTLEINHTSEIRRLESIQTIRRQLVDTATQDLRNPMVIIMGYAHLIDGKGSAYADQELREYAKGISHTSERIKNIISHMLDLSQVESSLGLQLEQINFNTFIQTVSDDFKAPAQQKDIEFVISPPPEDMTVFLDPQQMRRAVENLINNAIKFTPQQGKVHVSAGVFDSRAWISVQDTGPGIPAEAFEHLFEPFYRVSAATSKNTEGSGLGLTISKTIVERHHGEIWVDSTVGQGSTFRIELPVV